MPQTFDMILKNGTVHTPGGPVSAEVGVRGGKIAAIGSALGDAGEVIDCAGLDVLPGVIDSQVHFREPGLEHKEDLESGSRCAVMGGVTAVFEMPNTNPNTDTAERVADKLARAHHRMWCDHAFYVGATADNAEDLRELIYGDVGHAVPLCCFRCGGITGTTAHAPQGSRRRRVRRPCLRCR